MIVTIVTVVLNGADYIEECIASVMTQNYKKIEHIIIDGGSCDGTLDIIEQYKSRISYVTSEADEGMYDALNKGIAIAKGDLIGFLNSDDRLADQNVISSIVKQFNSQYCDAIYGNLNYVSRNNTEKITRKWESRQYGLRCIQSGWMPPHPTFYIRKEVLDNSEPYSSAYGTCGDYDFMLRLLYKKKIKAVFVDLLIVYMRNGGISNGSFKKVFKSFFYDYRILARNKIPMPFLVVFFKKIRKLRQFR
ncbi:MAG TPA: glycosyltransferase family 2 protein [Pedobacter sp.]|nr:glycosyltransferase family 2 protein [Pedobacter sp.]